MSSSYGTLFRITTFGESHGPAVGVVVDGCPPRISLSDEIIQRDLDRRRPGQSNLVTQRREDDIVEILSGLQDGITLGTPIALLVRNSDQRSRDYEELRHKYRPSHADFAYDQKYGIRAWSGGGRASARETVGRVAAGAIARLLLSQIGVSIVGYVEKVHTIETTIDPLSVTPEMVESTPVRCPDPAVAQQMIERIQATRKDGNSIGGIVRCVVHGTPAGWGEPVFDKLEAELAKALLSIPACKGFEIGSGFAGAELTGMEHNDEFEADADKHVTTRSNHSGGVQGGISNGMPILLRAAFKPTATVMQEQHTVTTEHENTTLSGRGRHDACVLPRAVPIVEAMVALVLADFALRQEAVLSQSLRNP
jgi:chorismate synthase